MPVSVSDRGREKELPSRNLERENSIREKLSILSLLRLKDLSPICLRSVDSTQDYLIHDLQSKSEGDCVIGEIQTKGKGREGREWFSDEGGLYLSITLTPERPQITHKIARMATTVIMDALEAGFFLSGCSLKAPNDVICRGKKISGVLVDAEVKRKNTITYLGIGVDLNNGEKWDKEMRNIATSYFLETGKKINIDDFIVDLLTRIDTAYDRLLREN